MPRSVTLPRGVRLLPSGRYQVRVPIPGERKQAPVGTFPTVKAARAALEEAKVQVRNGDFLTPAQRTERAKEAAEREAAEEKAKNITTAEVAEAWFTWQEKRGLKPGTLTLRRSVWRNQINPAFGALPIRSITPAMIDRWFYDLQRVKPGRAWNAYVVADNLFRYASGTARGQSHGMTAYIEASPCHTPGASKRPAPKSKPERETCTPEEVQVLADRMPDRLRLAILLAGWSGLRQGEALELRRRDVFTLPNLDDPDGEPLTMLHVHRQVQPKPGGGLAVVPPKTAAGRRDVPVPPNLVDTLKRHLKEHVGFGPDALLFPRTERGDDWTTAGMLAHWFKKSLAEYNAEQEEASKPTLRGFTLHKLRHSALTRMGEQGATTAELMAVAGHADGRTVEIYQHTDARRLAALAARLPVPVQQQETAKVTDLASARSRSTKSA
ncbi:MAG: tyrosine-type recombinase/integrase [Galactobacter sp.]